MRENRTYSALIVDDSEIARADLKDLLQDFPQIKIIGEADSVDSASKAIKKFKPDLIFLDIQFPGESGFDLLEKESISSKIIFVTAYDAYALRAFKVNALDYLLKPVHKDRLSEAILKLDSNNKSLANNSKLGYDDLLFIELGKKVIFLRINTILKISSAGSYSEFYDVTGRKGLVYKTMKEWVERLPEKWFVRIHRSTIINVEHIERIEESVNRSYNVFLKEIKEPLVMSRRQASKLKEQMG